MKRAELTAMGLTDEQILDLTNKINVNVGSVDAYLDSYYNLRRKMKEADVSKLPEMLFTCGTDDSIFKNEIEPFKAFLKEIGMEAKWSLGKGNHEWRVWERDIQIAFSFFVDDQQVHGNAF